MSQSLNLDDAILEEIEHLAEAGCSDRTICDNLGLDYAEWDQELKTNEVLQAVIETGRRKGVERVTQSLYLKALSGDVTAAKFYLLARDGGNWEDATKKKMEHSIGEGDAETAKLFQDAIRGNSGKKS